MKRLQQFLDSEEFYSLMQTYRHAFTHQAAVVNAFNGVREAVLEAAGKRFFTITSVGYNNANEPVNYTLQPSYGNSKKRQRVPDTSQGTGYRSTQARYETSDRDPRWRTVTSTRAARLSCKHGFGRVSW